MIFKAMSEVTNEVSLGKLLCKLVINVGNLKLLEEAAMISNQLYILFFWQTAPAKKVMYWGYWISIIQVTQFQVICASNLWHGKDYLFHINWIMAITDNLVLCAACFSEIIRLNLFTIHTTKLHCEAKKLHHLFLQ